MPVMLERDQRLIEAEMLEQMSKCKSYNTSQINYTFSSKNVPK